MLRAARFHDNVLEDRPAAGSVESLQNARSMLLDGYCRGREGFTAEFVCVLSHHLVMGGVKEVFDDLALRPNASSGNYSRHLKHVLEFNKEHYYQAG